MARLEDPRARQQFADVMATPEMQRAMAEVSSGFAKGVALGLSNEELTARLEEVSRRLTQAIVGSLAQRMANDLAPASAAVASAAVEAAMRAAVRAASEELPATLAPAMRQALTDALGPAMETVLRDNVGHGLTTLASAPELHSALGATSRAIARDVVYGTNEALAELEQRQSERGLLARVARFFVGAGWVSWILVAGGALVAAWLFVRRTQRRAHASAAARERELREAVLLAITTTLRAADGRPWADELRNGATPAARDGVRRDEERR